ncbi:aminotransferase class V [Paraburkholderia sp. BL18I3N2]|nr:MULTISPECIES: aminotransferase class V-fold PLP-dependent enzyme [unclassified Paraburkholderia]PRX21724.1 aminotransferase class V [Paraburkholderia sp. BL18I3N2]PRX92589.1 aminotransferase class V [Paraburkholderia sp. BL25I1N1]
MSDFQRVSTSLHPRGANPVHLDHAATTPVNPRVIRRMLPYLTEMYGNSASRSHAYGWVGEEAMELAREQVSALVNGDPHEIVWTSWGSGRACGSRAKCTAASTTRGMRSGTLCTHQIVEELPLPPVEIHCSILAPRTRSRRQCLTFARARRFDAQQPTTCYSPSNRPARLTRSESIQA